jgi:hypothetical protein
MLPLLIEQVAILVTALALLGVPGAALVSLLRLRSVLPDTLAVPAAAIFGALVACLATAVQLTFHVGVVVPVVVHVVLSLGLAGWAWLVRRRRRAAGDEVVPVARGWGRWTTALMVVAVVFAWIVRGAIRLDGLYHVALSRKLVELAHPTFNNVNRFADGGPNPAYALPGWHALVGWTAWIAHSDPIISWEIMPVLVVALGALAGAGLARVLLASPRAEPVGALTWVLARVLFARREVDGDAILYGAVPGQVVFELVIPVLLATIAIALFTSDRAVLRRCWGLAFACIVAIVILHANYLPYVAFIGLGYAAWWAVRGPFGAGGRRRLLTVGGAVAAMSVACMAVVLPLLASLQNFGNAPEGDRIDYHLTNTNGWVHIRAGHFYEMLGLPGLLAIVAVPFVAARWRGRELGVASGGLLGLMTMCLVPPLYSVMRATGSLTLGLRINHVIGTLLAVMLAGAILLVADEVAARGWTHRRRQLWGAVAVCALVALGVVLGYDRFASDWPGIFAWLAMGVLFLVYLVRRLRGRVKPFVAAAGTTPLATGGLVFGVALVITLGLALPVGAISMRRAIENSDDFTARTAQGDLRCLGGPVGKALQRVPARSQVLSDPVASFRAMALAPVYVVGDYKVWTAATSDNRAEERLARVNKFFDTSLTDEQRLQQLDDAKVDYLLVDLQDGRWLDGKYQDAASTDTLVNLQSTLDRFADVQDYDGGATARLIDRHPERFQKIAVDMRADVAAIPEATVDDDAPCNSYGLWKVAHGHETEMKFLARYERARH